MNYTERAKAILAAHAAEKAANETNERNELIPLPPEAAWRAEAMRPRVPRTGPMPFLAAQDCAPAGLLLVLR
jgi:hypothetical protein